MRSIFVRAVLVLTAAAAIFSATCQTAGAQTAEPKTAEQVFKNIVQLKGIPADQLTPTMQMMAVSLGVNCEFCHVQGQMDADDKGAKKTARNMIAMTMAINQDSFRGQVQVSCYSCHRGSARPVGIPPVLESDAAPAKPEAPRVAPPAGGAAGPSADDIIQKYITALGGADAMHKITSRAMSGKILTGGNESGIEVFTKAPNKRITVSKMGSGESFTAFDGTAGWMGSTGRPARDMSPAESASSAVDAEFYLGPRLKEMYPQVRRGRPEQINGSEAQVLQASAPGKPALRLYFDSASGLLVRMVRYTETPVGRMPVQIDYADYREQDGVKAPYRWTLSRPNGRFTIQIDQMKDNAPIEDSKFAKR
jgi:photosynthetic reaction center cytochrome c subunit